MQHTLMELPFAKNALEPMLSQETIEYHYGKHHAGYVKKLNAQVEKDSRLEGKTILELVKSEKGGVFNNAAQVYNHDFYWNCLVPNDQEGPSQALEDAMVRDFGSVENCMEEFTQTAATLFGSGWTWLSLNMEGKLVVEKTCNANTPIRYGNVPLLTCDVWEHAFYIDYRNDKAAYINKWWELVNWEFVSQNFDQAKKEDKNYIGPCNDNTPVCDYIDELESGERVST